MRGRKRTTNVKGKVPRLRPVNRKKPDILDKILSNPEAISVEIHQPIMRPETYTVTAGDVNNIKRHAIGHLAAVEAMFGSILTPKCKPCYERSGWLTKCVCEK